MSPRPRAYALEPAKPSRKRQRYGVFDIETRRTQDTHAMNTEYLLGGATIDGETCRFFTDPTDLARFILKSKHAGIIWYTYNGGRFDFAYLLQHLPKGYAARVVMAGSRVLFLHITQGHEERTQDGKHKGKRRHWRIWDFNQVLPGTLRKNLEAFHCYVQKGEADYTTIADTPETRAYLAGDVLGLYELIATFYAQKELQGVRHMPTAASLSLATFRTHFLHQSIPVLKPEEEAFCRSAYLGGRTQPLQLGHVEDVTEYDVHSMYGWAMTQPLPCSAAIAVSTLPKGRDDLLGIVRAQVDVPEDWRIGPLPVVWEGRLIYPVGHLEGVWCSPELRLAEELGCSVTYGEGYVFKAEPWMRDFSHAQFAQRESSPAGKTLAKLLHVAVYGKLGMKRERQSWLMPQGEEAMAELPEEAVCVNPELNVWQLPGEETGTAVLPHVAAMVTSYARTKLLRALLAVGSDAVYCDTDSVYVANGGTLPAEMCGDEMGKFGIEGHSRHGFIIGSKAYLLLRDEGAPKTRLKGVPAKVAKETAASIAWGNDEQKAEWWQFIGLREAVRARASQERTGQGLVGEVHRERTVHLGYAGGQVQRDGRVLPLNMDALAAAAWEKIHAVEDAQVLKWQVEEDRLLYRRIRELGGIRRGDYEDIPRALLRRQGWGMDEMAQALGMSNADELYRALQEIEGRKSKARLA